MNLGSQNDLADLRPLHTFGLPGQAQQVRFLETQADLLDFFAQYVQREKVYLLGEGSNTVFINDQSDTTVWVMGMKGRQYLGVQDGCHVFRVAAGENWHNWVQWSVSSGYPGLENLALIPGSVGASPIQNIGAYGVELKDRVRAVHGFHLERGETMTWSLGGCQFAYRDSVFKRDLLGQVVITEVDFALPMSWQANTGYADVAARCKALGGVTAQNVMNAVTQIRTEKLPDPATLGNSGSFFKNPIVPQAHLSQMLERWPSLLHYPAGPGFSKLAAGWLIDQCGLKGHTIGGVQVYPKQALILINSGDGKPSDLMTMIKHIQNTVADRFDVVLEPEPNLI